MQVEIQRMRLRIDGFNLFGNLRALCRGRSRQHCKKTYCGCSHRDRMISTPRIGCKLVILCVAARFASHREVASFLRHGHNLWYSTISRLTMLFQKRRNNLTGFQILLAPFP